MAIQLDMFTRVLYIIPGSEGPVTLTLGGIVGPGGNIIIASGPGRHISRGPGISLGKKKPQPPPPKGLAVIFGAGADDAP